VRCCRVSRPHLAPRQTVALLAPSTWSRTASGVTAPTLVSRMRIGHVRLLLTACMTRVGAVVPPLGGGVALAQPTADFHRAPKPVMAGTTVRDTGARACGGAAAARAAPARVRARPSASGARRAASARRYRQTTARGADFRASRRSSCARYSGRATYAFAGFGPRAAAPAAASSARSRAGGDDLRRLRVT
jgi:hypothetical protein